MSTLTPRPTVDPGSASGPGSSQFHDVQQAHRDRFRQPELREILHEIWVTGARPISGDLFDMVARRGYTGTAEQFGQELNQFAAQGLVELAPVTDEAPPADIAPPAVEPVAERTADPAPEATESGPDDETSTTDPDGNEDR